ncbi:MAG: hypothetical protein WA738_14040 [Candidatus Angelobacter sp.]
MTHEIQLEVHEHKADDVYHDRARIPENFRGGFREGRICKVRAGEHATLLEIRGLQGETRKIIRLDDKTRDDLHLDVLHSYDFSLRPVWWVGQFRWAWNASDSASRIAARLGLLGLILGLAGIVIGLLPLLKHG